MSATALMDRSKTSLAGLVNTLQGSRAREKRTTEVMGEKLMATTGALTAFATAAAIGLAEGRVRDASGRRLSLGPVPLSLAGATGLTVLGWFWNPGQQVTYAAAGAAGSYGHELGKAWGASWLAKAAVGGVGYEGGLTAEEKSLLAE